MYKLGLFLLGWSLIGLVGLVFWFGEQSLQERIDSRCYYYRLHGVPIAIVIEGTEYGLAPDGRIDPLTRPFVNPYHEELLRGLADGDCLVIDTEGGVP